MPRMSKKLKKELAFFLNEWGRRAYNELCRKCQHECKQRKRSLNELEQAGMIMRVWQGVGEANHIYILLPKENADHE